MPLQNREGRERGWKKERVNEWKQPFQALKALQRNSMAFFLHFFLSDPCSFFALNMRNHIAKKSNLNRSLFTSFCYGTWTGSPDGRTKRHSEVLEGGRFILHWRAQRRVISKGLSLEHRPGKQFVLFYFCICGILAHGKQSRRRSWKGPKVGGWDSPISPIGQVEKCYFPYQLTSLYILLSRRYKYVCILQMK